MYRLYALMLVSLLAACDPVPEHKADSTDSEVSQQVVDETVSARVDADTVIVIDDVDEIVADQPLLLDITVPPPAHGEIEYLPAAPKADIGNVFVRPENKSSVNVSGEPLLNIEKAENGKEKVVIDGAKMTIEKAIR